MRKYGAEGFLIQSVEHAEAQDKAFDLEKQWIADLDTYHGQGYNMSEGGESPPHLTGEDNPMYGRTGEDAPMYGRGDLVSGENNGMYGRGDLVSGEDHPMYGRTGEDAPMYGRGDLVSGENNGMYGRTGEDNPMHGRTGEDHPMYGRTGENASNSSLSRKEAAQIKWYALATERTQRNIGARFGISARQVGHIKNGSRWPNLAPNPPADNGQLRLPLGAT
ncbi:hypothetical protein FGG70_gp36 [Salinibacter phage M1EM-1]|uniref:Uncharacterized protein n=1 Tax=Salinibacter phage M1EM-1 TaxID=2681616 RepID=A0A2I6UG84_9CAUD|nr:hypothetical protein FGG70_gp36 [Salinibacter phage M1EM-1]AUO78926.1 hypothetical protein [Salinibacter phage M1EM-1]